MRTDTTQFMRANIAVYLSTRSVVDGSLSRWSLHVSASSFSRKCSALFAIRCSSSYFSNSSTRACRACRSCFICCISCLRASTIEPRPDVIRTSARRWPDAPDAGQTCETSRRPDASAVAHNF
eukprot:4801708-Prymnesium_polylepis.1